MKTPQLIALRKFYYLIIVQRDLLQGDDLGTFLTLWSPRDTAILLGNDQSCLVPLISLLLKLHPSP